MSLLPATPHSPNYGILQSHHHGGFGLMGAILPVVAALAVGDKVKQAADPSPARLKSPAAPGM